MYYLAIDIGSTTVKAALIDAAAGVAKAYRSIPLPQASVNTDYIYEVSADKIYLLIEQLLKDYGSLVDDKRLFLRFSTQMHGFILANQAADALTPYISWRDNRSLQRINGSRQSFYEFIRDFIQPDMSESGSSLKPNLAMCNLYAWLQQEMQYRSDLVFCTLGSWLGFKLTGKHASHITNAAATGLVNARWQEWNRELICDLGFQRLGFPDLLDDYDIVGEFDKDGKTFMVLPDTGDQQTAVLGTWARADTELIINVATAGQLASISKRYEAGAYECRPYFRGSYLKTVTGLPAGRNLDVLVRFFQNTCLTLAGYRLTKEELYSILETAGRNPKGLDVELSFFQNTLECRGGKITGILQNNLSVETIFNSAYQNMAVTYQKHMADLGSMKTWNTVVMTGGVIKRNQRLAEIMEQTIGIPRRLITTIDTVMEGHYRLALVALGIYKRLEDMEKDDGIRGVRIEGE